LIYFTYFIPDSFFRVAAGSTDGAFEGAAIAVFGAAGSGTFTGAFTAVFSF